jgi:hypothetical protein
VRYKAVKYEYRLLYEAAAPEGGGDLDIGFSEEDQQRLKKRNEKRLKRALEVMALLEEYDLLLPDMVRGEGMDTEICLELFQLVGRIARRGFPRGKDRKEYLGKIADYDVEQFHVVNQEDKVQRWYYNCSYNSAEDLYAIVDFITRIRDTFVEFPLTSDRIPRKFPFGGETKQQPQEEQVVKKAKSATSGKKKDEPKDAKSKQTPPAAKTKGSKPRTAATSVEPELSPQVGPDQKLVEDAVTFINEKANEALYKYSIEIGNYLLEKFFDGDVAAACSRNPRKFTSYRALCKHPDLGPSAGALSIMLRVAAQEKLFELKNLPVEKLSYSHKAELVKVFDDKVKIKLFKETVKKSLNVRQLIDLVRAEKGLPPITAAGTLLEGNVTRFNFEALLKTKALADPEALKSLSENKRNELRQRVEGAYAILAQLLEEYGRLMTMFSDAEK